MTTPFERIPAGTCRRAGEPARRAIPVSCWAACLLVVFLGGGCDLRKKDLYICVPVRPGEERASADRQVLWAIQLRIDEINALGGAGGRRLVLTREEIGETPDTMKRSAEALGENARVSAMIGHCDPVFAGAFAGIEGDKRIPMIATSGGGSEILGRNAWVFSMSPPVTLESEAIAAHLATFWMTHRAAVLRDGTDSARQTSQSFHRLAEKLGIQIRETEVPSGEGSLTREQLLAATQDCEVIVVLGDPVWGAALIRVLRDSGVQMPIFGTERLASGMASALGNGSYLQNLYVTTSFMYELADRPAIDFQRKFRQTYRVDPGAEAAFAYDAVTLLWHAIRSSGVGRKAIQQGLGSALNPDRDLEGITGPLYFLRERFVPRSWIMTQWIAGQLKPAFRQLHRVEDAFSLRTLEKRIQHGYAVMIDGVPYFKIEVVYVGIDFLRLNDVNVREKKFGMNLILWYRWVGETKTDDIEFTNALGEVERTPIQKDLDPPVKWAAYHIRGTFTCAFDLHNYPFDRQELSLALASRSRNGHRIQLVFNQRSVNPHLDNVIPGDWVYLGRENYAGNFAVASNFGYPDFRPGEVAEPFSQVHTLAFVQRNVFPYFVTLFLPLGVIVTTTILLDIFLSRHQFGTKVSVCTTSLLSVLVFQLTQDNTLPQLGYVTLVDRLFMVTYFFMCAFIANDVFVNHLAVHLSRESMGDRLDRWGKIILSSIAIVAYVLVLLPALSY